MARYGARRVATEDPRNDRPDRRRVVQADLFNDELPPGVPERQVPTPEEVEAWIALLPF